MSLRQVQWLFGSWGDKFVFVGVIRLEDIQILGGEADAESRIFLRGAGPLYFSPLTVCNSKVEIFVQWHSIYFL